MPTFLMRGGEGEELELNCLWLMETHPGVEGAYTTAVILTAQTRCTFTPPSKPCRESVELQDTPRKAASEHSPLHLL